MYSVADNIFFNSSGTLNIPASVSHTVLKVAGVISSLHWYIYWNEFGESLTCTKCMRIYMKRFLKAT